jgi:hypothetical protein
MVPGNATNDLEAAQLEAACACLQRFVEAAKTLPEVTSGPVAFRLHYADLRMQAAQLAIVARSLCDAGRR